MNPEQNIIEQAWENRANLSPQSTESGIKAAVKTVIGKLDRGELRVAEKIGMTGFQEGDLMGQDVIEVLTLSDPEPIALVRPRGGAR